MVHLNSNNLAPNHGLLTTDVFTFFGTEKNQPNDMKIQKTGIGGSVRKLLTPLIFFF